MIKLPFIPKNFPVSLILVYWLFLLCFYLWYLPFSLIRFLFSPYSSSKRLYEYYMKSLTKQKRNIPTEVSKEEEKKDDDKKKG